MARSGIDAWEKYFKDKEVKTSLKEDSFVYDQNGNRSTKKIPKDSIVTVLKSKTYSSLTKIKYGKNLDGFVSFGNINKPHTEESKKTGLKPSDITPKIVDTWLEAEDVVKNTKKYLSSIKLSESDRSTLESLLDKTLKTNNQEIDVSGLDPTVAPAEFYEILTGVKLAILMRNNDPKTRKILGVPKDLDLSRSKIKIMIPKKANMPLLDYYISISASSNPNDVQMKISVKSKIKGESTNTIKFKDAFSDQQEIEQWYRALTTSEKTKQKGQKVVAESAVNAPKGKALMYPINAVAELLDKRKDIVKASLKKFKIPNGFDQRSFESAVKTLAKKISTLDKQKPLDSILEKKQLEHYTAFMKANLLNRAGQPLTNFSIGNGSLMCEKILARAAHEDLKSIGGGLNFYRIFYDQILKTREIAYATAKKTGSKNNLKVKYEYYSKINWEKEYGNWVALRSKNLIDNLNDTLGMDIQSY